MNLLDALAGLLGALLLLAAMELADARTPGTPTAHAQRHPSRR